MADPPPFDSAQSFCGNCGAAAPASGVACLNCGRELPRPVSDSGSSSTIPVDYVPYCRSCGTTVEWGKSHNCQRCGVAPLCSDHFNFETEMCWDCASLQTSTSPAYLGPTFDTETPQNILFQPRPSVVCLNCEARIHQRVSSCPQCGSEQVARPVDSALRDVEYIGFWVRFAAFVIDWLITIAVGALIGLFGAPSIVPVIIIAYFVGFTANRGQTPGKMLLRIQVVDASGQVPKIGSVLLRETLRAVLIIFLLLGEAINNLFVIVSLTGMIGYIWIAWDAHKRGWHDYLGRTFVVRKHRPKT